jgi:hypothetical protein
VARIGPERRIAFWIARLTMEARTVAAEQQSVKLIFDEAAEIASPLDRAAYLERACGDDAGFRRKVYALLRAFDEAGSERET